MTRSVSDAIDGRPITRAEMPPGFVFGAATSAYQIEGSAAGGCGPSHWESFAAIHGKVVRGEDGARACDHYNRWAEDLDLVRGLGADAYRFSLNWSRVLPDGRTPNPEGLDFYDRLVDGMLERGLAPNATLYHWDLPQALADRGGWTGRETASRFADYAALAWGRLGDRLASVATINEPWCVAWLSHYLGAHAPGLTDLSAAARAMHVVLLAHAKGMEALRAGGAGDAGIVLNMEAVEPRDDSPECAESARLYDGIYNRWFADAIFHGRYPADLLRGLGPHLPEGWEAEMEAIAAPIDWIGLNYYTRALIAPRGDGVWPDMAAHRGDLPSTAMGWEIYPEGLRRLLLRLARDWSGDLPIYVTENGMASDSGVDDDDRAAFHFAHLRALRAAAEEGAPVRGYFVWSLLDNFEWAEGYDRRFGVVHVDYETMARRPKRSYRALAAAFGRESA